MDGFTEISGKKFAIVLTKHRLWGYLFIPYIFVNEPNKKYFRLTECLSPYQSDEALKSLDNEEREVVRIINEYSDRALFKLFSKDNSVKDFLIKVTPEKTEKFIRPYIERRIRKCFIIAKDEGIVCFRRKPDSNIVHPGDRVILAPEPAIPLFIFNRDAEGSTYKLEIETEGESIELFHNPIEILCNSPCIILESGRLLLIEDIDGPKLKPFFTKENIKIPKVSEIKYFSGFVLNAVTKYKVKASGFRIISSIPEKSVHLSLEPSVKGIVVLIISFCYSGRYVSPEDPSGYITVFDNDSGEFVFTRYLRDTSWESGCREMLSDLGFISDDNINFYLPDEESDETEGGVAAMIEAVNRNYNDLIESGFTIETRKLDRKYNLMPVNIEIMNTLVGDWFDLRAVIKIDKWEIPFIRFRHCIIEGIREFELPDGTFAVLPREWFTKYRNIFEFGKDEDDLIKIHKQHFPFLSEILDKKDSGGIEQLEKLLRPEQLSAISKPAGMNCEMREYQVEGLNWLNWLQSSGLGGCLADDMGLGKTIQALALLQSNIERMPAQKEKPVLNADATLFDFPEPKFTSLVVLPATLIYNWESEIRRFVPGMKVYSHKGIHRTRTTSLFGKYDIVISSYHTVRQDIELLSSFKFHYVILDESQSVKNPGSQIYRSVTRLRSGFRLVLSGTPVENSLTDLWAQLNFVNPGLLGSLSWFRREFTRPIEKMHDEEQEAKLKKLITPFILRRTKEMVAADLPPVTEQAVYCDMTEEQAKIYEEEKSIVRNTILSSIDRKSIEKSAIVVLQGLMRLRQISNHPVLAEESYPGSSGKFETVLSDIENVVAEGHKILLFSSFVMHLKLFATALGKKNIGFSVLTGASINREAIVNSFQNEASKKVFLISLKAGGVGLNLTAADYVFILDPWWNPASEMQALNRAHRIGQEKSVFVYRYISTGTLEEKIIKLQERKSKLADSFVRSNNPLKDVDIRHILDIVG